MSVTMLGLSIFLLRLNGWTLKTGVATPVKSLSNPHFSIYCSEIQSPIWHLLLFRSYVLIMLYKIHISSYNGVGPIILLLLASETYVDLFSLNALRVKHHFPSHTSNSVFQPVYCVRMSSGTSYLEVRVV